jgi:hypothetical protein
MIGTDSRPDAFADAVHATAYIATVHVRYGELMLPPRVREHVADGPVVVHLVRGEDDVAQLTAQLTSASKLVGIEWPADIAAGTRVTVMCPRGAAGHDVAVQLPDLPQANVDWPDEDLPAAPAPDPGREGDDESEQAELPDDDVKPEITTDVTQFEDTIVGALAALAEVEPPAETVLAGPAECEQPTETIPAISAAEQTEIAISFGRIDWPADEQDQPASWPVDEPTDDELTSMEVVDLDRDYRPQWRRALAFVRENWTPTRATYVAATGGTFIGSLVTWLVTR